MEKPRWLCVQVEYVAKFKDVISLADLHKNEKLADMMVLKKGQRLSVQPVGDKHFEVVKKLGGVK
ncbi:EVE domain protein [compost metagenome]